MARAATAEETKLMRPLVPHIWCGRFFGLDARVRADEGPVLGNSGMWISADVSDSQHADAATLPYRRQTERLRTRTLTKDEEKRQAQIDEHRRRRRAQAGRRDRYLPTSLGPGGLFAPPLD